MTDTFSFSFDFKLKKVCTNKIEKNWILQDMCLKTKFEIFFKRKWLKNFKILAKIKWIFPWNCMGRKLIK